MPLQLVLFWLNFTHHSASIKAAVFLHRFQLAFHLLLMLFVAYKMSWLVLGLGLVVDQQPYHLV